MKVNQLEPLVDKALRSCEEARKDDFVLYYEVAKELMTPGITFKSALLNHKRLGLPPFESVSRCRRKLQERDNSLKDKDTALKRESNQQEFIDYAMCDKVIY
jgi:hypothetical protein